jgi:hypothetical protein
MDIVDGDDPPPHREAGCPFCHARNHLPAAGEVLGEATWVPWISDEDLR